MKKYFIFSVFMIFSLVLISCSSDDNDDDKNNHTNILEQLNLKHNVVYIRPNYSTLLQFVIEEKIVTTRIFTWDGKYFDEDRSYSCSINEIESDACRVEIVKENGFPTIKIHNKNSSAESDFHYVIYTDNVINKISLNDETLTFTGRINGSTDNLSFIWDDMNFNKSVEEYDDSTINQLKVGEYLLK